MNAYLSITRWPEGIDEAGKVRLLCTHAGIDPYTARLCAVRGVPLVAGRFDEDVCKDIAARLATEDVGVHSPTKAELAAIVTAPRVKALHPALGAPEPMYTVECWDGRTAVLKSRHIVMLVRARLDSSSTTSTVSTGGQGGMLASGMLMGAPGIALAAAQGGNVDRSTRAKISHVLDIYVKNGTRVRIDGDKFSFEVLGDAKSYSDLQNMDILTTRLGSEAPRAVIETGFKNFKCPGDIVSDAFSAVGGTGIRRRNDAGPFDFFSAWIYLLHKAEGII
ncbi:MAG: hypothetical protein ACOYN0_02200 [Phycisphaerales bacterium]